MRHKIFRAAFRKHLRAHGYSKEQATRMVGQIGDGKIKAWIIKWGPTLLKIFLAILPLFLMAEPPTSTPFGKIDPNDDTEVGSDDD